MEKIKQQLKHRLDGNQGYKLLHFMSRNPIMGFLVGLIYGRNLTKLAVLNNTDKHMVGSGEYMRHYQTHLRPIKYKKINLLEIGVGGYERADRGGCSLRMWKRYFPFGNIYAIDIYDKSPQEESRIKIFKGSQIDFNFLDNLSSQVEKPFDIIIDDGSHINEHVIHSFQHLFPKLESKGLYVVEDVETSYRDDYGGDSNNLKNPKTIMNFFKGILDGVNHTKFKVNDFCDKAYHKDIASIHFYNNLIFIYKI